MRYFAVPDIVFTDADGNTVTVKDMIQIKFASELRGTVPCDASSKLDEIATRPYVYGEGTEANAYKLFDENAREILENRFDLGKVKTLRIPKEA